jgi:uncharacterized protein (TIRG00374 family)
LSAPLAEPRGAGRRRVFFGVALAFGVALLVLPVVLANGRELLKTAAAIQPSLLALAVAFTLLSYAAMSRSYQGIAEAAGCALHFRDWVRITFVSNTVNYLVTSAGLSGFAVRMYLLSQRGVPSNRAVLISLVQTFLTNVTLLFFVVAGFAAMVLHHSLSPVALAASSGVILLFACGLAWAVVLVYHRPLRRRTLFFFADAAHRILRRVVPRWSPGRVRAWRFQHNLNQGLEFMLQRKARILAPAAWILLDWLLAMSILWAAFRAVNYPIAPGVVAVGFAVGICLSLVSIVPGGIGLLEGSMTAIFVSFGVPLERAFVAVLIFRVVYYLLPLCLSLFFFHGVMVQAAHTAVGSTRSDGARI